jgi:hypothetical protein
LQPLINKAVLIYLQPLALPKNATRRFFRRSPPRRPLKNGRNTLPVKALRRRILG